MHDAIIDSHRFWCDRMGSSSIREKCDIPFNEVLEICMEGSCLWTCIYRIDADEHPYWEFGATTLGDPNYYIWALVSPMKADIIFELHGIEDRNAYL
jgi:hypothetical protein